MPQLLPYNFYHLWINELLIIISILYIIVVYILPAILKIMIARNIISKL